MPLPERFDLSMATAIVAAIVAIVSAFYLPASAAGVDPRGDTSRLGGRMTSVVSTVAAALGVADGAVREPRPGELTLEAERGCAADARRPWMRGLGGRLMSLFASDERARDGTLRRASRVVAACPADVSPHLGAGRSGHAVVPVDRGEVSGGELVRA